MTLIRLFGSRYHPADATGARLQGGRWNSPGHGVLYASSSLALACLEVLVHLRDMRLIPPGYRFCEVAVPDGLIISWTLASKETHALIESPILSREFGDRWLGDAAIKPLTNVKQKLREVSRARGESPEKVLELERRIRVGKRKITPVQAVPSVIIPREMNYLINPAHPQFDQLRFGEPMPFRFDPRLL